MATQSSFQDVSVLFTNIRSVLKRRTELSAAINSCSANIVALTETWLHRNIRDSEIFETPSTFHIYRCDREARQGGGVLVAISKQFESFALNIPTNLEIVWVSVKLSHRRFILAVCYRPPNASSSFAAELHDTINSVITRYPSVPLFLLGDFNLPGITWTEPTPHSNPFSSICEEFINLCSTFNLTQIVDQPTRTTPTSSNLLDLVLTTCPDLCSPITFMPKLSDHSLLNFSISIPVKKLTRTTKILSDYRNADFAKINDELHTFLTTYLTGFENHSVEYNWCLVKNKILELTHRFVPARVISYNPKAPWYNAHIRRLSNRKKRLYRLAKKSQSQHRWTLYRAAAEAYVSAVQTAKKDFLKNTLPSMLLNNTKKFWNVLNPPENNRIVLTSPKGEPIGDKECSTVLNSVFSDSFTKPSCSQLPEFPRNTYVPMYPIIIDTGGISKIINSIKTSGAFGVDGISPKFLKNTNVCCSILLAKIFQQSLDTGELPDDFKIGKVVPAFKSGDKHSPLNYRPISITSVPCKILEHIIYSHISNFLESNSFFHPSQHGFRKTFSCETQLLLFTHKLHAILDRRSFADCIFLDFAKAFDKVSHRLLLLKLRNIGIETNVLKWLESFLTNRQQFVTANDVSSSLAPVISGVPQGTVLGPLLFLIYINDLPNCVSSSIHLFADDCVFFREITTNDDIHALQSDINAISNWCSTWQMKLNVKKCKFMRVSRLSTIPPSYHLDHIALESVSSYKYLGLHITTDLSWKKHIDFITNKANRMLGYLKRNFQSAPSSIKLLFYKSIVRSQLEYASSIWDPHIEILVHQLEMIQNNSARFILSNYQRASSVSTMKLNLGLPLLTTRRKIARLCLFHKIFYHDTLHDFLITPPSYVSSRLDHSHKVGQISCHTTTFSKSFIPSTSKDWNHLPRDIAAIVHSELFNAALHNTVV